MSQSKKLNSSIVNNSGKGGQTSQVVSQRKSKSRVGRSFYASGYSRANSGFSSRKSADEARTIWYKYPRITGDHGEDATPLSLLTEDKRVASEGQKETPSDLASQSLSSQQQQQQQPPNVSQVPIQSSIGFGSRSMQSSSFVSLGSQASDYDDYGDRGSLAGFDQLHWTEMKTLRDHDEEELTEEQLEQIVDIDISETETIWMFEMKPKVVQSEGELADRVKQRNAAYKELLNDKVGNDKYVARCMYTLEPIKMPKLCQTEAVLSRDADSMATTWDLYDSYLAQTEVDKIAQFENKENIGLPEEGVPETAPSGLDAESRKEMSKSVMSENKSDNMLPSRASTRMKSAMSNAASVLDSEFGTIQGSVASVRDISKESAIFSSVKFQQTLFVVERAIVENNSQSLLAQYRNLPLYELASDIEGSEQLESSLVRPKSGVANINPAVLFLWKYYYSGVRNQTITSMKWNSKNQDILAVAYGKHEYEPEIKVGQVCCWSVKNIQHAERIYHTNSGVTALDWCHQFPSLLAVGLYDGNILIYDVRSKDQEPVFDSYHCNGRHLGPVRQLQWVKKESGKSEDSQEVLVSISSDGHVNQWSIRKGFEYKELMRLKRVISSLPGPSLKQKQKKADALISRFSAGSCLAFNPNDINIYLIGTEDGNIHKCSCSYNEQYLETYFGHSGPVYDIAWSPFLSDVFLSCAADWTICLWHVDQTTPICSFQSTSESVNCISWSPKSSCVFACVNDGRLEVWNLAYSTLDPVIKEKSDSRITQVSFANNSDSILIGDADGGVHVYKLENMPGAPRNQEDMVLFELEQAEALDKVMQAAKSTEK